MLKRIFKWQVVLGIFLLSAAVLVYYIHYLLFRDMHHIFIYLIGDIAFLFIDVLLVVLVLHKLLNYREKQSMFKKLNMVIGAFFSEVGTPLLKSFSVFDIDSYNIAKNMVVTDEWSDKKFLRMRKEIKTYNYNIDIKRGDLVKLRDFLLEKRNFLLNLLENPNLLEHESFTNLLWAVFHLTEELIHRKDLNKLPESDYQHLANDVKRAYNSLVIEWISYMSHLKNDYPYLFSLAVRTNPFDANASVEIIR